MEGEAEPWKKLTKALLGLKLAAAFWRFSTFEVYSAAIVKEYIHAT